MSSSGGKPAEHVIGHGEQRFVCQFGRFSSIPAATIVKKVLLAPTTWGQQRVIGLQDAPDPALLVQQQLNRHSRRAKLDVHH